MKSKISLVLSKLFLVLTITAFAWSLFLILYYFDIIPNRNVGFLDISHLIAGIIAGVGVVTGLLSYIFYRLSKKNK